MPRSSACPSPSSRPSTPPPRHTCGWRGSWSPVVLSPDEDVSIGSATEPASSAEPGFRVSLSVFDGPFDLLLTLLSKHELDITEVSLSLVTREFIAYLRQLGPDEELEEASEFLVVAATLLDMKG